MVFNEFWKICRSNAFLQFSENISQIFKVLRRPADPPRTPYEALSPVNIQPEPNSWWRHCFRATDFDFTSGSSQDRKGMASYNTCGVADSWVTRAIPDHGGGPPHNKTRDDVRINKDEWCIHDIQKLLTRDKFKNHLTYGMSYYRNMIHCHRCQAEHFHWELHTFL